MRYADELRWIEQRQGEMTALLGEFASINTGSYNVAGLGRFAGALKTWLTERGFAVREKPLSPQRIVTDAGGAEERALGNALSFESAGGNEGPRVLLGIHYDTVFGADDPFQKVTREGEKLRGPGVCDAKGGLVVLLYGLLAFFGSPLRDKLRWEVLLNPDEEIGSPGSGALWTEAAKRSDVALLFEPALPDGALVSSRKGSGNFAIVVRGRAAHAGRDAALGRNAIHALARVITKFAAMQNEIPGTTVNTGFVHGGGPVNIVPDMAMTRVNVRVETAAQQACVEERLAEIVSGTNGNGIFCELSGGFHCPPKVATEGTEKMLRRFAECGREIGMELTWRATGGACDGNRIAAMGVPAVDSLGVRGGGMHTDQEFVELESLPERAKLLALYLMRLAEGQSR